MNKLNFKHFVSIVMLLFMSMPSLAGQSAGYPSSIDWRLADPQTIGLIEHIVQVDKLKTPADGYVKVRHLIRNELFPQVPSRMTVVCSIYYIDLMIGVSSYGTAAQISNCSKDNVPKAQQVIYSYILESFGDKNLIEKLNQFASSH